VSLEHDGKINDDDEDDDDDMIFPMTSWSLLNLRDLVPLIKNSVQFSFSPSSQWLQISFHIHYI